MEVRESHCAAPGISQFLIQVWGEQREALLDFARAYGHGVDVSEFISQYLLDDAPRCAELVRWYRERLPAVSGLVTLHGALWDLAPSSRDGKVRAATMARMRQCLDIAEELRIDWVTFHLDFFPLAHDPNYFRHWVDRQAEFWQELVGNRPMGMFLENIWEPRPEVLRAAVQAVDLPRVAACLDVPHVHLNSPHAPGAWVREVGGRLGCLHVSDNDGTCSQHLPPGQGTIDWEGLLGALVADGQCVPAVIEVSGVEGAQATIEYLRSREIAPGAADRGG